MGCCFSSPNSKRIYRNPDELEDEDLPSPLRTFGSYRNNSNVIPDDIEGLPNTHLHRYLAEVPSELLYDAEIDQGFAFRCVRPIWAVYLCPFMWIHLATTGISSELKNCTCDEVCCWVRKEYSSRNYIRVYSNRIEVNIAKVRWFGMMGCGSWNTDSVTVHLFDRGAFGFRRVPISYKHMCCFFPAYGQVVGRQRCPCNGSLWPRIASDCGGWWCDEWICDVLWCTYKYDGLVDGDEFAFAASIALQAYFENRHITKADMDKCILHWRENIRETTVDRVRPVCCGQCQVPCLLQGQFCYTTCTHMKRRIPPSLTMTERLEESYNKYELLRNAQIQNYKEHFAPRRMSSICRVLGCRRLFGRKGFFFCTEDINKIFRHKVGDPAPPFTHEDIDDENDAARVLQAVLGDPPTNVLYVRSVDEGKSPPAKSE